MERYLLRIWMFVLAFCFGISVSAAWRIYTLPVLPDLDIEPIAESTAELRAEQPMPDSSNDGLRIVGGTHACGALPSGAIYELSDGGRIEINCTLFRSRAAARQELERRLLSATIEESSLNIDSEGKPVGDEVLITAPNVQRLRIKGKSLCVTEATSLKHLRWFEKPRSEF
jgi:hypothetical protein